MKRLTLIIMAGLLMLGLTQCKKEQTNTNANAEGEWVTITVKVDAGDRHIVYPGTGAVVYSDGDKIYVGNNGHYVGTLTYNDGAFSGQIQSPSTADYLHFYFIGGEYTGTLNAGTTESFDWSIADQSDKLPVLSYGHSTQKYTDDNATYGCTLENQCALVKFSLAEGTSAAVTVGGMHTVASINFADGTIVATSTTGNITLYSESAESTTSKWAILLPQDAVKGAAVTVGGNDNYTAYVPAVTANMYYTKGVSITEPIDPYFTVNESGKRVYFAPGNLQFNPAEPAWRFAEHQWDFVGSDNIPNITGDGDGWIDLFCWGTSGFFDLYGDFGPLDYDKDADQYGNGSNDISHTEYDWGSNWDRIGYGENYQDVYVEEPHYTMTKDEWNYLLNSNSRSGNRYAKAIVNGVPGMILLPDLWDTDFYPLNGMNAYNVSYSSNEIGESVWEEYFAPHGVVFLPAAGWRDSQLSYTQDVGGYWTGSFGAYLNQPGLAESQAYMVLFTNGNSPLSLMGSQYRNTGFAVRLVRDAD